MYLMWYQRIFTSWRYESQTEHTGKFHRKIELEPSFPFLCLMISDSVAFAVISQVQSLDTSILNIKFKL